MNITQTYTSIVSVAVLSSSVLKSRILFNKTERITQQFSKLVQWLTLAGCLASGRSFHHDVTEALRNLIMGFFHVIEVPVCAQQLKSFNSIFCFYETSPFSGIYLNCVMIAYQESPCQQLNRRWTCDSKWHHSQPSYPNFSYYELVKIKTRYVHSQLTGINNGKRLKKHHWRDMQSVPLLSFQ